MPDTLQHLKTRLRHLDTAMDATDNLPVQGTIVRLTGFLLEARGLQAPAGSLCTLHIKSTGRTLLAEVIGFSADLTWLMPFEEPQGIVPGTAVSATGRSLTIPVGNALLGRVLDGFGNPIDNKGPVHTDERYETWSPSINPIQRARINTPLDVGVRAVNALLTVGEGQRMGIFAGSGVGKSVLLGMFTRFTEADVVVAGLVGERGREVKEFIEENIGVENLHKTVIVAAPVDTFPLERTSAAAVATTIAEYFRDQGKKVLLIVDSLTRYAQALRQIYLTLGEMPASRGYSPSVFSRISQLVERTGNGFGDGGSITAFYTVLTEGDDPFDPVSDHARSILDGHILLSRKLAEAGHYPAIDISASISRVMNAIVSDHHRACALRFKTLYNTLQENQDIIGMDMYQAGTNPTLDEAIRHQAAIKNFLQQGVNEVSDFAAHQTALMELLS